MVGETLVNLSSSQRLLVDYEDVDPAGGLSAQNERLGQQELEKELERGLRPQAPIPMPIPIPIPQSRSPSRELTSSGSRNNELDEIGEPRMPIRRRSTEKSDTPLIPAHSQEDSDAFTQPSGPEPEDELVNVREEAPNYREGYEQFQAELDRLREAEDTAERIRERLGIQRPPPTYFTSE